LNRCHSRSTPSLRLLAANGKKDRKITANFPCRGHHSPPRSGNSAPRFVPATFALCRDLDIVEHHLSKPMGMRALPISERKVIFTFGTEDARGHKRMGRDIPRDHGARRDGSRQLHHRRRRRLAGKPMRSAKELPADRSWQHAQVLSTPRIRQAMRANLLATAVARVLAAVLRGHLGIDGH
jgi:hypothetical protein